MAFLRRYRDSLSIDNSGLAYLRATGDPSENVFELLPEEDALASVLNPVIQFINDTFSSKAMFYGAVGAFVFFIILIIGLLAYSASEKSKRDKKEKTEKLEEKKKKEKQEEKSDRLAELALLTGGGGGGGGKSSDSDIVIVTGTPAAAPAPVFPQPATAPLRDNQRFF